MIPQLTFGIVAAGTVVLATATTQMIDGDPSAVARNQLWILLSSVVTLLYLIISNVFQIQKDKRERRWKDEDRRRHEEAERQAMLDRQQLKDDVRVVHARVESTAETAQDVRTELAKNTEITKQAAQAVTDGFKDSVAASLKAAFDERFGASDLDKATAAGEQKAADINKPKG